MKRKSKRELVLDIYDNEAMGEVTAREIAVINQALIEEYGEGGAMSPAEIARILHDEDLPVRFDQVFRMMTTTEKYENAFARFLENDDLAEAEKSIRGIDELYRKFKQAGDRAGVRFAFEAARTARRAFAVARSLGGAAARTGRDRPVVRRLAANARPLHRMGRTQKSLCRIQEIISIE
jgi:hypothetical protein